MIVWNIGQTLDGGISCVKLERRPKVRDGGTYSQNVRLFRIWCRALDS